MDHYLEEDVKIAVESVREGWCSQDKALAMAGLIVDVKPKVVVEIGVFSAKSMVPQAIAMKSVGNGGVLYGIDPWSADDDACGDDDPINAKYWKEMDWDKIHKMAIDEIWSRGLQSMCVLMKCHSYVCAGMFRDIDILHIDGNHAEFSSTRDVKLYLPLVKPGGHIWFDDANWPQTQKAIGMMNEQCDLIQQVISNNTCNLYRKHAN